ncbi:AAA family ATPase [Streptomyces sp. NPDC059909]|uniref:AAA family ATPase n=1 Tax=Streptomyces sp. NPDC059909 TaxID=3346998 RepID=UPI00365B75D0
MEGGDPTVAPSRYGLRFPALGGAEPAEDEAQGALSLRVGEALLDDVDRGIVRIDPYLLAHIGAQPGAVVAITGGRRRTVATAQAAPPPYAGTHRILTDGMVRENAGAVVGDRVLVSPVAAEPARTLLIEPLDAGTFGPAEVAEIRESLAGRAVAYGDRLKVTAFSKRGTLFKVAGTDPEADVVVGPFTDVRIKKDRGTLVAQPPLFTVKYEDIGGLEEEVLRVRELVELPLKYPALFARLKIEPPKGVLLYGPPGSGKTLIARAVASEVRAHFIHVNGPEIIHKFYGESEAKLREIFDEAQRRAPSVIFLDEIDAIAPRRADVSGDVEKRVVAQLLASMDGLVSRGEVVVIAATNLPEAVDPALRRPGRFDREIPVNVPSRTGRLRILQIHSRGMPLAGDVDLAALAEVTHGFVGADLEALCKEAGMLAVRDCFAELDAGDTAETEALAVRITIRARHFAEAFKAIEPTATREFFLERPNVHWDEIGGLDGIRRTLVSAVELPRRHPSLFAAAGVRPPTGFVLAGPSGTGKSLMVKALATETGLRLITVDAAALFSKWVGESEKGLHKVFKKAKESAPCILFFDGLDGLVPRRHGHPEAEGGLADRLTRQFFTELDEAVEHGTVTIVGATNRLDLVDPAALRPGRFGSTLHFPFPDTDQRARILAIHLRWTRLAPDVDLAALAQELDGLSGAEIAGICQRAVLAEIERLIEQYGDAAEETVSGGLTVTARTLNETLRELKKSSNARLP